MSKKAKKKKKKAQYPTKEERALKKKAERALLITLLCEIVFAFIYAVILKKYYAVRCPNALIVCPKIGSEAYIIISVILLMCSWLHFAKEKKKRMKPIIFALFCCVCIFICFWVNCNAWVIDNDSIHHSTLFKENKREWRLEEISSAELYYNTSMRRWGNYTRTPAYDITTNDGKEIRLMMASAYFDSSDDVIEFNERLSPTVDKGNREYFELNCFDDKLNEYYKNVFEQA